MAATADAQRTPLTSFETIALMLRDLPDVASDWDALSVDERLAWSLDWGNEMSKLGDLGSKAATGRLSMSDHERYHHLVTTLAEALPIIDRLGLRRPSVLVQA